MIVPPPPTGQQLQQWGGSANTPTVYPIAWYLATAPVGNFLPIFVGFGILGTVATNSNWAPLAVLIGVGLTMAVLTRMFLIWNEGLLGKVNQLTWQEFQAALQAATINSALSAQGSNSPGSGGTLAG